MIGIRASVLSLFASLALACSLVAGCGDLRIPDPDVVYIAFGDSATEGPADRDYADILAEKLGEPASHFAKEGHGGETLADGVERLRDLLADEIYPYPNAEVLLYWEGATDLIDFVGEVDPFLFWSVDDDAYPYGEELEAELDDIEEDVSAAIALARGAGLDVYVATYFPIYGGFAACPALPFEIIIPGQADRANEYLRLLNARIRRAAGDARVPVVDIGRDAADLPDDSDNYVNCNHLSTAGNTFVAEIFSDALR